MKTTVIEHRKIMLENFVRVALLYPLLMGHVLSFFSVTATEVQVVVSALRSQDPKPVAQNANDGEELIKAFNARLLREPNNKARVIEDFDQGFFGIPRFIRYEFAELLLADAVPLCGDVGYGSKALDIVSKLMSREWVRSHQEFRNALVKIPAELLSCMKLDEYLMGEVRGAANSQAFAIFSTIYDHCERTGQKTKAIRVLNNNRAAMETFQGWANGQILGIVRQKTRKDSEEWMEESSSDTDISLKHRSKDGYLEVMLTTLIHARPEVVQTAISDVGIRNKWDKTIFSYKVLKEMTENTRLVFIEFDFDRTIIPVTMVMDTTKKSEGGVEITYKETLAEAQEDQSCPLQLIYVLKPTVSLSGLRKCSGESSDASSDESPASTGALNNQSLYCQFVQEVKIGIDLRKHVIPELIGERNTFKEACLTLRYAAEHSDYATDAYRSPSTGNLSAAFDNKFLRKTRHSASNRTMRNSLM